MDQSQSPFPQSAQPMQPVGQPQAQPTTPNNVGYTQPAPSAAPGQRVFAPLQSTPRAAQQQSQDEDAFFPFGQMTSQQPTSFNASAPITPAQHTGSPNMPYESSFVPQQPTQFDPFGQHQESALPQIPTDMWNPFADSTSVAQQSGMHVEQPVQYQTSAQPQSMPQRPAFAQPVASQQISQQPMYQQPADQWSSQQPRDAFMPSSSSPMPQAFSAPAVQPAMPTVEPQQTAPSTQSESVMRAPVQPIATASRPMPAPAELFGQTPPAIDTGSSVQLSPQTVHQSILSEIEQEELFGRERLSTWQKVLIVTVAVLTLGVVAGAGIWVYVTITAPAVANTPIAGKDSDGDGLSDIEERNYGTNPNSKDTDGDGYGDGEEIENGYSPLRK